MGAVVATIHESIRWRIGEDRTWRFQVRDRPANAPEEIEWDANWDVPTGFDSWTFTWQLREKLDDTAPILDIDIASPTDVVMGWVDVPILRADTLTMRPGRYKHALARTNNASFWVLALGDAILDYAAVR